MATKNQGIESAYKDALTNQANQAAAYSNARATNPELFRSLNPFEAIMAMQSGGLGGSRGGTQPVSNAPSFGGVSPVSR